MLECRDEGELDALALLVTGLRGDWAAAEPQPLVRVGLEPHRLGHRLGGGLLAGATRWRVIPARANGQLAFGLYAWDEEAQAFLPRAVDVLTLHGARIQEITAFLTPAAFRGFDLPATLTDNA